MPWASPSEFTNTQSVPIPVDPSPTPSSSTNPQNDSRSRSPQPTGRNGVLQLHDTIRRTINDTQLQPTTYTRPKLQLPRAPRNLTTTTTGSKRMKTKNQTTLIPTLATKTDLITEITNHLQTQILATPQQTKRTQTKANQHKHLKSILSNKNNPIKQPTKRQIKARWRYIAMIVRCT